MARIRQDFDIWAGDHKELTIEVEDVPNLNGAQEVTWIFAESALHRSNPIVKKTLTAGQISTTINSKEFTVYLVPADTRDLISVAEKRYYHEGEVIDAGGNVSTVSIGTMTVRATVI